jgi:shikimate kinase
VLLEEQAGCSIDTLVARDGWARFRDIEKGVVHEVSMKEGLVIATGGGVVTDEDNVKDLRRNGLVVWLKADAEVLRQRMDRDEKSGLARPPLTGTDPLDEIKRVLKARTPLYREAANLVVETDALTPEEVASRIIKHLPEGLEG